MTNIVKPTVTEIVYDHILNNQAVVVDTVDASMSLDKLNIDSLEKISLAMDLEEHFEIDVSDQQIEAFVTVADIIVIVTRVLVLTIITLSAGTAGITGITNLLQAFA